MYTLDTNAIIYYMENDETVAPLVQGILDDPIIPVYVSTITESELFSHTNMSEEEAKTIDTILQAVSLVPPVIQYSPGSWASSWHVRHEAGR